MGENNENLLKAIRHYQDSLDRHTENRNEYKLLHYLDRLYKLPIKVAHLEQTGVGRTVNGLRKLGGEVGEYARRLVTKWKEMVVGEQEEEEDDDDEDGYQTGEEQSSDSESKNHESEKVRENSSSHRKSDKNHNGTEDKDKVRKSRESSSKSSHSSESKSSNEKGRHKENGHDRHKSHKRKTDSDSEDESPKKKKKSEDESRHRRRVESDSEEDMRSREKKHRKSDKHEKKKSRDSSDDSESEQDTKSKEKRHKSDKKKIRDSSEAESDDEAKSREKKKSDKHKPSTSKDTHRDKHKHSKKEDSRRHENSSKAKESDKRSKHKSEDKEKARDKSEDKKEKKKVVNGSLTLSGIDSGSGTSFAEALGMCEPSSSKGSSKKKSSEKKEKVPSATTTTTKVDESVPKLLKEPTIEPLDLNLSSLLPSITPNYRPLGNLMSDAQPKKFMSESETLTSIITSKNQRTKVYSGNKIGLGKVPTLFDLCTRILQDNIDALEYTGGVPYLILKPILEKATPNQLYVMEHHNPYLIEETDELWQLHCQKEFRNKRREELETWREMYLRCLDERDAKLKALTANIKQSQDKSIPVRMTKLAYVDAVAKPPRNIARKQAKNGTAFDIRKPSMTPSARLNSLATSGEAGKVAVPNPGSRASDRPSSHATKPKKAPLMLKSISSFKNRFKR